MKLFKKKNAEKLETIFPSAEDMLKATSSKWPTLTPEEILQKITQEMSDGERHVYFFRAIITKQSIKELRHQGYYVQCSTFEGTPCFKVEW